MKKLRHISKKGLAVLFLWSILTTVIPNVFAQVTPKIDVYIEPSRETFLSISVNKSPNSKARIVQIGSSKGRLRETFFPSDGFFTPETKFLEPAFEGNSSKLIADIKYQSPSKSYILKSDSLYRLENGRDPWKEIVNFSSKYQAQNFYPDVWSVGFVNSQRACVAGVFIKNGGGNQIDHQLLLCSNDLDDKGDWKEPDTVPEAKQLHILNLNFADEQNGWAVGTQGTIWFTGDGGKSWTAQRSGSTDLLMSVYGLNPDWAWAVGANSTILNRQLKKSSSAQVIKTDTLKLNQTFKVGDQVRVKPASLLPEFINSRIEVEAKVVQVLANKKLKLELLKDYSDPIRTYAVKSWLSGKVFDSSQVEKIEDDTAAGGTDDTPTAETENNQTSEWKKMVVPALKGKPTTLRSVKFADDQKNGWIVGDGGTILYTSDGGINWRLLFFALPKVTGTPLTPTEINFYSMFIDDIYCWVVGSKGTIVRIKYK